MVYAAAREPGISIHSAIASGDGNGSPVGFVATISIHSAIASGDGESVPTYAQLQISIHSAIASGDCKSAHIIPYNHQ